MAGFSSHDDYMKQTTVDGRFYRADWNKNLLPTTNQAQGQWYSLAAGTGNPTIDATIGSSGSLTFNPLTDTTSYTAATTALNGNMSTTTFTDTTHSTGRFTVGQYLTGAGVAAGTQITALGTGTGQNNTGTYTINISQTVTSQTITGTAYPTWIQHGGSVSSGSVAGYKQILNASAYSAAATSAPCLLMLVDILGFYCVTTVSTTGDQTMTTSASLPRYTDGNGVRAFIVPSIVMAANTPNIRITYTSGVGSTGGSAVGRITPNVLPVGNTAAPVGSILYSGTAAGKYGPFLPMMAGDTGIKSIEAFNLASTYGATGVLNIVLCKPLFTLPITTIGVASERDFVNQLPSLPRVYDGACLTWLMYAGAAHPVNSSFYGHIDFGWS